MKSILSTILPVVLVLCMAHPALMAQSSDNGSITVSGTVIEALNVEGEEDLVFGDIVSGEDKTVAVNGNVTEGSVIDGSEQAGRFRIGGPAGFSILLEYTTLPAAMDGIGEASGNTLPVSYASVFNSANSTDGATTLPTTGSTETTLDGGELFVFLGGTVSPAIGQTTGDYETEVTLTATFAD